MMVRIGWTALLRGLALLLGVIALAGAVRAQETAAVPTTVPNVAPGNLDEIQKYCGNMDDKAADARYALQARQLAELRSEVDERVKALEQKRREYEVWLKRRNAFVEKAQDSLVDIISRMKPEAAAEQIARIGDEAAASLLLKLNPRVSSTILNEMPAEESARLARIIVGAQMIAPSLRDNPARASNEMGKPRALAATENKIQ